MKTILDPARCSGCGACKTVCPVSCIAMREDGEGFRQPVIDAAKCLSCGACGRVCPVQNPLPAHGFAPKAYGGFGRDEAMRQKSTSGGLFSLLARQTLCEGGVVFGAAFGEGFRVRHEGVRDEAGLAHIRGSKYMESDLGDTFDEVKALLAAGTPVLYSGVPCQIAGLRAAVGEYEKLLTVDILCHGAPSPLVWDRFLAEREEIAGAKAVGVAFRDKRDGWRKSALRVTFANGEEFFQHKAQSLWMRAFLKDLSIRRSCFDCAYKTDERPGDVTLGDFWGVEKLTGAPDDDGGMSVLRVNSEQGRRAVEALGDRLTRFAIDWTQAAQYNFGIFHSAPPQPKRREFFARVGNEPFESIVSDLLGG